MCQTENIPADQQAFPEFACIQDVASLQSGPQAGDHWHVVAKESKHDESSHSKVKHAKYMPDSLSEIVTTWKYPIDSKSWSLIHRTKRSIMHTQCKPSKTCIKHRTQFHMQARGEMHEQVEIMSCTYSQHRWMSSSSSKTHYNSAAKHQRWWLTWGTHIT